ncbi:MAG: hypothetical protein CBB97_09865 [Candidatus Endolissoclinum sp. TMED37]|jgi:hypothetical protein|nr:MAG: hypothetical protein CBB97_09865 [Candidatus Endolissoclinum sp. TMED37]|tara:strand:- start:1143 stop:1550 length:408 start_codon:yes stop_codon:yes gene_type:complete
MKNIILAGSAALAISACSATNPLSELSDFTKMTGSEIQTLLPGNSLRGTDNTGSYVIYYSSASTMEIDYTTSRRNRRDTGTWRVSGDRYCRQWEELGKGEERCVTLFRRGNTIHWVRNNEVTDRSVLENGNPAGL